MELSNQDAVSDCVYLIHASETPYYKIGISIDVDKRLYSLRSSFPFIPLMLIATHFTPANRQLEKSLHAHFHNNLLNNEWFSLADSDIQFMKRPTEYLLNYFYIVEEDHILNGDEESEMAHEPQEISPEPASPIEEDSPTPKEPERLTRVPDGVEIPSDKIPSLEDEFHLGLVPEVKELYEELGTWQAVADHYGVPKEIIWAIGVHEEGPISFMNDIRIKLGLSTLCAPYDPIPADVE